MIMFKNRFAEFDNLDDSHNENVLRNCYYREFHRNFLHFGKNKLKGNFRYSNQNQNQNYNDIRLKNFRNNNNTIINSQRINSITPFPKIPLNNRNNMNNNFNNIQNLNFNQGQNMNLLRSTPNYSKLRYNNNYTSTPRTLNNNNFNNMNNNSFNNNSFENSFNNSNDSFQYFNENENIYNNNNNFNNDYNYNNNSMNNSLNISNEYQFNQNKYNEDMEYEYKKSELENEIKKERQKQLLLEQERLNQIEKELNEIRLKRNNDLKRKLEQKKIEERLWNLKKMRNKRIKKNNSKKKMKTNKSFQQSMLEESLKANMLNDRLYMKQLIDEITRMKVSQNEANEHFMQKIDDLYQQNEMIKSYNKDLMTKLKDVKYAIKDREDNPDTINDYLIEQHNKRINSNKNYFNKSNNIIRNNYLSNQDIDEEKINGYNYRNYFLGKKDKDEEEFNLLNQNLVNGNNGTVVSPLIYDKKNYNNRNIRLKSLTKNENNKDDIYSLIRRNNDRLDRIKELEEKMNFNNN